MIYGTLFKHSTLRSVHSETCTAKPGVPFVTLCTGEALSIQFFKRSMKHCRKAVTQRTTVYPQVQVVQMTDLTFGTRNWTVRDTPPSHEAISIIKPAKKI